MNSIGHYSLRQVVGSLGVGCGLALGGYMISVTPALFMIPLRKILVALGGVFVTLGILVTWTDSFQPLTPARSVIVVTGVSIVLVGLLVYDLLRLGGDSLPVVFKPLQGFLVAAACGVPLGSALKHRRTTAAVLSLSGGVIVVVLIQLHFREVVALPGIALVVLGSLAVLVGYALTSQRAQKPLRRP